MTWTILLISAVFEAIWATALGESNGFTEPVPTIIFAVAMTISMLGLARAMKVIPLGTAYAVWTGTGAALTVAYALITGTEQASFLKILFLIGIIAAIVGLKLLPADGSGAPKASAEDSGSSSTSSSARTGVTSATNGDNLSDGEGNTPEQGMPESR